MFTLFLADLNFAFLEYLEKRIRLTGREGWCPDLFDNGRDLCCPEGFLQVSVLCNLTFGDVYEDTADLKHIVQICFSIGAL